MKEKKAAKRIMLDINGLKMLLLMILIVAIIIVRLQHSQN